MTKSRHIALLLVCALICGSCADMNNRDKYALGGMAAGAAAGAAIGSKSNSEYAGIAMIGGAIIGGLIGMMVGTRLDEAEKAQAELAAKNAAINNKRITWSSDKRGKEVGGYAEPIREITPVPAPAPTPSAPIENSGGPISVTPASLTTPTNDNLVATKNVNCRRVREVVIIQGQEKSEETTYCNSGQGWMRAG